MKVIDFLVLLFLFLFLFTGVYFLWLYLPSQSIDFEEYYANLTSDLPPESVQFYPNMRYVESDIGYFISPSCSAKKQKDFERAVQRVADLTILDFHPSTKPQITVTCSNVVPDPDEVGHFVAGEGGPSAIINASRYAIILSGKIALFRPETCDESQVATHELLHALGFDHNNNSMSIMYPYTNCEQTVDQGIIDEINRIYASPSQADLLIESVTANKTGAYINFEVTISNYGLKKVDSSNLSVIIENKLVKDFEVSDIDIGAKRKLTVQNLRISRKANEVTFVVKTADLETSKENNVAKVKVVETAE